MCFFDKTENIHSLVLKPKMKTFCIKTDFYHRFFLLVLICFGSLMFFDAVDEECGNK